MEYAEQQELACLLRVRVEVGDRVEVQLTVHGRLVWQAAVTFHQIAGDSEQDLGVCVCSPARLQSPITDICKSSSFPTPPLPRFQF